MTGEAKHCEVYGDFFKSKGFDTINYNDIKSGEEYKYKIEIGILFATSDMHFIQDLVNDIYSRFKGLTLLPILGRKDFYVIDSMFKLGMKKICFEFAPDQVMSELNNFLKRINKGSEKKEVLNDKEFEAEKAKKEKKYIIHFYESKQTFFIDMYGPLSLNKLIPLKLMFKTQLAGKIQNLKGVVYLFNNVDEDTMEFQNIWAMFRFWEEIGLPFKKVHYLSASEKICHNIHKYLEPFGIHHAKNLLEIIPRLYKEYAKADEMKIFEFSSELLQTPYYTPTV